MRIQIGTGYYGLTTVAKPSSASSELSEGFRRAISMPADQRPEVILAELFQPASQPAAAVKPAAQPVVLSVEK